MQYYKEIDLENISIIQEKCLAYIKSISLIYERRDDPNPYRVSANSYAMPGAQLIAECPELAESLEKVDDGFKCESVTVYIVDGPQNILGPHIDHFRHKARLNIPLLNCVGTKTEFYSNVQTKDVYTTSGGRSVKNIRIINTDYIVESTYIPNPNRALIFLGSEAHRVIIPKNHPSPRIMLSLSLDRDPVYLLED